MIDLVLHRYGGIDCLNRFDVKTVIALIHKAADAEADDLIHRQWSSMLPLMSMKMVEYVPFSEYRDKVTGRNLDLRPSADILADVNEIRKQFEVENG